MILLAIVFLSPLTVDITVGTSYEISFGYFVFELILTKDKKSDKKRRKKANLRDFFSPLRRFFARVLKKGKLTLKCAIINLKDKEPNILAIQKGCFYAFIFPIMGEICSIARFFSIEESAAILFEDSEFHNESSTLRFSIEARLYTFAFSALIFAFDFLKRRLKRKLWKKTR